VSPASALHPEIRFSPLPPFLMLVRVFSPSAAHMERGFCAGSASVVECASFIEEKNIPEPERIGFRK